MNIGELKQEIMNLAFEETASMSEYKDIVIDAVNRAVQIIHSTVRPILGKVEVEQTEPVRTQFVRYDMAEIAESYMSLAGSITLETSDNRYIDTIPHKTEGNSIILLPGEMTGTFTIWYKRIPTKITLDTPETDAIELDYDLHVLIPLLASYYVWLDDDERKATMYYNQYDDLKSQIMAASVDRPVAVIEGGVNW